MILTRPKKDIQELALVAFQAGIKASEAILDIYARPYKHTEKADGSPITEADRLSNKIITGMLAKTGVPLLSEESAVESYEVRSKWDFFWLIDPLDGTVEFINRNGEFTVNIALLVKNQPLLGMILAPVLNKAWWGIAGENAYLINGLKPVANQNEFQDISQLIQKTPPASGLNIGISRSHMEKKTFGLLDQIRSNNPEVKFIEKGSSLKFCDLVEGKTDLYARYSATSEWDTAAGHALLRAMGGEVFHIKEHQPISYNKRLLSNPGFIAFARKEESSFFFEKFSF
ncbi:MAG TPA: 3'(2'),5'-bisphosphate nucleotidase CysQ [Bacteroidales bacterium]|nr:3'(2'),5'-bisphosphate nucleotidase CysQ [Bacteroidales bacterium]